jgi:hypothetical protein
MVTRLFVENRLTDGHLVDDSTFLTQHLVDKQFLALTIVDYICSYINVACAVKNVIIVIYDCK